MAKNKSRNEFTEAQMMIKESGIAKFLQPSFRKRTIFVLLAVILGLAYALMFLGRDTPSGTLYNAGFGIFVAMSFPSFLLWSGYGVESLAKFGIPFYSISIALEALWLYLISCFVSETSKKGK